VTYDRAARAIFPVGRSAHDDVEPVHVSAPAVKGHRV
jgi:hypothetical protein